VIHHDAAFRQEFLDVAVREGKAQVPPTASRITSGSNWRHLNRPETVETRDIGPAYQRTGEKLQHFLFYGPLATPPEWLAKNQRA
jgi:hypothetical protein